jgi:osmotically inducible protein OsmC
MALPLEKIVYTAHTHTVGGRHEGTAKSDDGQLDIAFSTPGSGKPGTNPEQLFAAGWSACFIGALGFAAQSLKVRLPQDTSVDAAMTLGVTGEGKYQLAAKLTVNLPGIDEETKNKLVEIAHQTCPYSRATRGDI